MKLNLQSKLLVPTLAAVIVGMLAAAAISYRTSRDALRDTSVKGMSQTAEMGERQIHAWVDDLRKDIHELSTNPLFVQSLLPPELAGDSTARAEELLRDAKETYGIYENLAVLDAGGKVVAATDPKMVGTSRSDRDYFREAMAGKISMSPVIRSKTTQQPVFVVAAPLHTDESIDGVLFASIDLAKFTDTFIAPIRMGEKGYAFVVDSDGRFVAHPDKALILDTNVKKFTWGESFLAADTGLLTYEFKGENKILYHLKEPVTGWKVAVSATEEDIFAPIAKIGSMNLLVALVTILIVAGVIFFLVRNVVRALRRGIDFAGAVRRGDVSHRLNLVRSDELGELSAALDAMADGLAEKALLAETIAGGDLRVEAKLASDQDVLGRALAHMVTSLNDLLGQVQTTSGQIATGAAQVSDGSQSLSQGATESAASIEQIGSSLAQMASQTKTNAENATQANHLSGTAREAAENGNRQMSDMIKAMAEINEASQSISRIIKVIDEIAFQTNLLALNAAVEAARAGAHGKGFAVVAEEVRNLAARSAKAAHETAGLIEGSVAKAENGARIADRTAEALGEIVQGVGKVSDLVAEIAAASNEQAQGLAQVNIGLGQIDQVTQQNTANAEESAAAAEELAGQADGLRRMLERFRLRSSPSADAPPSPRPSPRPQSALPSSRDWGNRTPAPREVIALDDGEFGRY